MERHDNNDILSALAQYADALGDIGSSAELNSLCDKTLSDLPDDEKALCLFDSIKKLGAELVRIRSTADEGSRAKRLASLTANEKQELERVEKILDENLFTYHFQPIVSARTGEIYSYEALMRSRDDPGITPFLILKYAELTGRLRDIEKDTFINILRFIDENKDKFFGRPVFINSIPNTHLTDEDEQTVSQLLEKNSAYTVVEMTEEAEIPEQELDKIKEKYSKMNIRIAIDDYGTGYSNVKNLLRYTPNFVKIDRSLLSEVHNDPQKRHFVREIIDFCHENGILALAEGVETAEELRSVILFGVDLIQGYYTARPSPDIPQAIPREIRHQIKRFFHEREDGYEKHIYSADKNDRIFLERLLREGFDCIRVTDNSGKRVHILGDSSLSTDIHIEVADGFCGRIVIENAHLANVYSRPCIDIETGCCFEIECLGHIRLDRTGICVPEGAQVTFVGGDKESSLDIFLDAAEHYGIGNDLSSKHGVITFDLDTTVMITTESQSGVLIGSGLGGQLNFTRGRYKLTANGANGVCIGAFDGDVKYDMKNCDLQLKCTGAESICIGSRNGNADVFIHSASIKCQTSGQRAVAIGSMYGESAKVHIDCTNSNFIIQANESAALGAFSGESDVLVERSVFKMDLGGYNAYAFGGEKGGKAFIQYCDSQMNIMTEHDAVTRCDGFDVIGGSSDIVLNNEKIF
ncbi:MAG: EAL domain-containing protein [Ruminococcus sp.]|nr:EAL domain-containing protein [Ruminococcus sp.]